MIHILLISLSYSVKYNFLKPMQGKKKNETSNRFKSNGVHTKDTTLLFIHRNKYEYPSNKPLGY